jgi:hypothetical protein
MNHTSTTPDSDGHGEVVPSTSLANPRRTRLGADGHPLAKPVATSH